MKTSVKTSVISPKNIGNLRDFKEIQQKWLKIAEFRGQNYNFFRGRIPSDPPNVKYLVQTDYLVFGLSTWSNTSSFGEIIGAPMGAIRESDAY